MKTLMTVIAMSVTDAGKAEELVAAGARRALSTDTDRVLSSFLLWRTLGKVRVVRESRRDLAARSNAA